MVRKAGPVRQGLRVLFALMSLAGLLLFAARGEIRAVIMAIGLVGVSAALIKGQAP